MDQQKMDKQWSMPVLIELSSIETLGGTQAVHEDSDGFMAS